MFDSSFYNTFDQTKVEAIKEHSKHIGLEKIETIKLSDLFESLNLKSIDFLSVDVEGLDFEVLNSNNWDKYRPKVIVTEIFSEGFELLTTDKIYQLFKKNGYILFCNFPTNAFYLETTFFNERLSKVNKYLTK